MKYGPSLYILGLISTAWCVPVFSTADEAFVVLNIIHMLVLKRAMGEGYPCNPGIHWRVSLYVIMDAWLTNKNFSSRLLPKIHALLSGEIRTDCYRAYC